MKRSEAITKYRAAIVGEMLEDYRFVLEAHGRIQYQIYVWDDGSIECLQGPQGDNSWLKARDAETRELFYVTTVVGCNPWDCADHSAPEDDDEREADEAEIIDWLCDDYRQNIDDIVDAIIESIEQIEEMEEYD